MWMRKPTGTYERGRVYPLDHGLFAIEWVDADGEPYRVLARDPNSAASLSAIGPRTEAILERGNAEQVAAARKSLVAADASGLDSAIVHTLRARLARLDA